LSANCAKGKSRLTVRSNALNRPCHVLFTMLKSLRTRYFLS
jgi:hypothetical protein